MKYDCIIGIDPGMGGAIVSLSGNNDLKLHKMPRGARDINWLFKHYTERFKNILVAIEKVQMYIGDQEGKQFRIKTMLENYTELKSVMTINDIKFVEVHPRTWQAYYNLEKGLEKKDRKRIYKERAQKLIKTHNLQATLWNADAILILTFLNFKIKYDGAWVQMNLAEYGEATLDVF